MPAPTPDYLLVLDLETTGLDPQKHEILEIGAILVEAKSLRHVSEFHALVRPRRLYHADPEALAVNRFDDRIEEYEIKGMWPNSALISFNTWLDHWGMWTGRRNTVGVAGHRVRFDLAFLAFAYSTNRVDPWPFDAFTVDTSAFAWLLWRQGTIERPGLKEIAAACEIDRVPDHKALSDAQVVLDVLRVMSAP